LELLCDTTGEVLDSSGESEALGDSFCELGVTASNAEQPREFELSREEERVVFEFELDVERLYG
jgi:hypothetical protein